MMYKLLTETSPLFFSNVEYLLFPKPGRINKITVWLGEALVSRTFPE